jgi:NAD(P)H-hydrate epimerase
MLRIASVEQIRAIEKAADASGYSYHDMMDKAGRAAANRALEMIEGIEQARITILVGIGNNGGDGLVAGLYIAQDQPEVAVRFYLLKERDDEYIQAAKKANLQITIAEDDSDKRVLRQMLANTELLIDALFGIGIRLPIRGEAQEILEQVNEAIHERANAQAETLVINPGKTGQISRPAPLSILAIDCPSGLDCDTGAVDSHVIHADETITFISAKTGQFIYPGAESVGELSIADISISQDLEEIQTIKDYVVDSEIVRQKLPERSGNSHKGTYGRALVIAGSVNYIGAPALAAEAAYRAGAGLVTVGAPNSLIMALSGKLREATWMLLPHDMGVIAETAVSVIYKELNKMSALLVGPGLGTEKTTREFLKQLLQVDNANSKKPAKRNIGFRIDIDKRDDNKADDELSLPPIVIDADGLNLLTEIDEWWNLLPDNTIITPHPGEMARLAQLDTQVVQANRWQLAREKAKEWNLIVMLKGAHTIIASPQGDFSVLPYKTDALATAGTGDVLAGLIVGFLAQGIPAYDAAVVGAYVHGLAGQIAAENGNSRSVIAGDVLATIGEAFRRIEA